MTCPECLSKDTYLVASRHSSHNECAKCGAAWDDRPRRPVVAGLIFVACFLAVCGIGVALLIATWRSGQ